MKKQFIIRILMLVIAISAAVVMVVAATSAMPTINDKTEECTQEKQDHLEPRMSQYLLEALTRNVLGR